MKLRIAMGCVLLSLIVSAAALAAGPQANPDTKPTFASVLDHQLTGTEKTVVPAADAMPDRQIRLRSDPRRLQGRAHLRRRSQAHGSG